MKLYHVLSKNQYVLCISCIGHLPVVPQPITDKHIESMLLIAQVSHFLIFFIKNHSCKKNMPRSVKRLKNILWKQSRIETYALISPKTHCVLQKSLWFCEVSFSATIFVTPHKQVVLMSSSCSYNKMESFSKDRWFHCVYCLTRYTPFT